MLVGNFVTTGAKPLVAGSTYQLQLNLRRLGLWQDLTGAVVTMKIQQPNGGTVTTYTTTIAAGVALSQALTLPFVAGTWTRFWYVTLAGVPYILQGPGFNVIAAP